MTLTSLIDRILAALITFFGPVAHSIQGQVSISELYRSILTSLGSATAMGVVILILQGVLSHAPAIFTNPGTCSLATLILTLLVDELRRSTHGSAVVPVKASLP
jgi:hypothetical protein